MLRFFDRNNLSIEQKSRWESVGVEYQKIQEINVQNNFKALSPVEKIALMKETNCNTDEDLLEHLRVLNHLQGGGAQDEKSALFARLLEGRRPLIYPPPCSFSYPWYAVVEEQGPWEIFSTANNVKHMFHVYGEGEDGIIIDKTVWKLLNVITETEALITFGEWEDLGFMWKLSKDSVPCSQTSSYICSWHDKKLERITTLEQLKHEQLWHVKKYYQALCMVLDPNSVESVKQEMVNQYGEEYAMGMIATELLVGEEMLRVRRENNLSDYPTELELIEEVNKRVDFQMKKGLLVDYNGLLYTQVWRLTRVTPFGITKDIYI
jgi:hypothetical protein